MTKFPNAMPILLECARKETQGLWAIGDALVDETDGSQRALRKVRAALDERGLGQDPKFPTLRKLFDTSVAFPPDRRRDVSWKLHAEAGNPDFLDDILRENKRNPDTFCKLGGMLGFAKEHTKYRRWQERRARKAEEGEDL